MEQLTSSVDGVRVKPEKESPRLNGKEEKNGVHTATKVPGRNAIVNTAMAFMVLLSPIVISVSLRER